MRKHKFRIWSRKEKRWTPYPSFGPCFLKHGIFDLNFIFKNNEYIIQEFTGLMDSNGLEIYEGDIVEQLDEMFPNLFKGVVRYDIDHALFLLWREEDGACSRLDMSTVRQKLGNILENPELAP